MAGLLRRLSLRGSSEARGAASGTASGTASGGLPPPDKLVCLGKNYLDHQKEMGGPLLAAPVIFFKPPSAIVTAPSTGPAVVTLPRGRGQIHYETEIVLRLGADGRTPDAVTLGLDLTLRDVQAAAKAAGHPWEAAKAKKGVFAGSAVLGPWLPLAAFPDYMSVPFSFALNGAVVQTGVGSEMTTHPGPAVDLAAALFPLLPGDLLFTGTPAGVGPVVPGDAGTLAWGDRLSYSVKFR